MKRVISYIRFSSEKQAKGDSLRRLRIFMKGDHSITSIEIG